ncbi:MAG: cation:proton antiporter [Anaerolineales bacterium]
MSNLNLLIEITIALAAAFIGGLLARRVGLPTIVGYLLAGVAIGPFTPGFVSDVDTIRQLAELGVIFLMFGVGLDFSLKDLWRVRDIAISGALILMAAVGGLAYALSQVWGWSPQAGLVLAFALGNASTVVMMRGLIDNSLLNTTHGQAAVGLQVMQDLVTVFLLVMLPVIGGGQDGVDWGALGLTVLKAALFLALALIAGKRLFPWLFKLILHTRSRELFILTVLAVSLGTALGSSYLFGVSLALGAFVAGAVISESPLSYQVGADMLPFREAFAVLFFVSIGMLVNPGYLWLNLGAVIILTLLIVVGKSLIATLMGGLYARPARTAIVIGAGSSQIGEFSFILGQTSLALGMLTRDQYALILAGALLSIAVNPFMFKSMDGFERLLRRLGGFWRWLDRHGPAPAPIAERLQDHVVIIGYGRVGKHLVNVLETLDIPILVLENDLERVEELNERGVITLYGDASNSEVLRYAMLDKARLLVVTSPNDPSNQMMVAAAHDQNPNLMIISRAASQDGVELLALQGAQVVIQPELEGGLHLLRHTLLELGYPLDEVHQYAEAVRIDRYDSQVNTPDEHRLLHQLLDSIQNIEVTWISLPQGNPIVGQSLAQADLRARTGASVVAIVRQGALIANPKSSTIFEAGDRLGFIGEKDHIRQAESMLSVNT